MKVQLENIGLRERQASFHFFKNESEQFTPYWHYHPELEITFIVQGEGLRFVGDDIGPFAAGDLVLVGENLPHHWVSSNHTPGVLHKAIVIQFAKDLFDHFPECKVINDFLRRSNLGFQFQDYPATVIELITSLEGKSSTTQLSLLIQILEQLSQLDGKELSTVSFKQTIQDKKHQSQLLEITSYILKNHHQAIGLDDMARLSNRSTPGFCRWFKKSTGHTFIHYLQKVRIEKACQALITTDLQIAEIAYSVGFESISNFNRTFKKMKNKSPKEFRHQKT